MDLPHEPVMEYQDNRCFAWNQSSSAHAPSDVRLHQHSCAPMHLLVTTPSFRSSKRAPPQERREGHSSTITHITKLPSDPLYGLPAVQMHSGAEEQEFFVFIVQRHDGRSGLLFSSGLPYDQAVRTLRAQVGLVDTFWLDPTTIFTQFAYCTVCV